MADNIARRPKPKKDVANRGLLAKARAAKRSYSLVDPKEAQKLASEARDLRVSYRAIETLHPDPHNARTHAKRQIKALARSIQHFGFTRPILIDAFGVVIAGHGCLAAAKQLGIARVPTITLSDLTPTQARAYVIADNKLAELAGWDREKLAIEMRDLGELNFELTLTGFDSPELELLAGDFLPSSTNPDDIVPPPAPEGEPVSRLGDIWCLGKHRLACGDATDPFIVRRLLRGAKPVLMATDPPYAVNYTPAWRQKLGLNASRRNRPILNDDRADWHEAWALFQGDVAYVWHAGLHALTVAASLVEAGFDIRSQIIWNKSRFVIGRGDYHWQHEPCWYAVRKGSGGRWTGHRDQSTVWNIPGPTDGSAQLKDQATEHATQKPVECMRRPILNNTNPGDAVYDPFMGSGTTLIASERTGRAAHGVELDPLYVDVAVRRWQAFTGKDAILEETGLVFDEATLERLHSGDGAEPVAKERAISVKPVKANLRSRSGGRR